MSNVQRMREIINKLTRTLARRVTVNTSRRVRRGETREKRKEKREKRKEREER